MPCPCLCPCRAIDAEASNFLPFLIEKVLGHNHTKFRADTRDIIVSLAAIYPVSKVFDALRIGYCSKNKRVQAECLEESGNMIARWGNGNGRRGTGRGREGEGEGTPNIEHRTSNTQHIKHSTYPYHTTLSYHSIQASIMDMSSYPAIDGFV